ncbi:hypothetical protein C8R45DRAFT_1080891, partial [Mycena sanguinolenta]
MLPRLRQDPLISGESGNLQHWSPLRWASLSARSSFKRTSELCYLSRTTQLDRVLCENNLSFNTDSRGKPENGVMASVLFLVALLDIIRSISPLDGIWSLKDKGAKPRRRLPKAPNCDSPHRRTVTEGGSNTRAGRKRGKAH